MSNKTQITRWYVSAIILAKEYSALNDKANGLDGKSEQSQDYRNNLDMAIRKAILNGELKAYSGGHGAILDADIKAYLHGVIYLDQFCEWAQVSLIGCPKEPRKLATMMGIPLESDVGTFKSEDVKLVVENSKDKTDTLASTLSKPLRHKIQSRPQPVLSAEISKAQELALDKADPTSVWTELVKLAEGKIGCLIGVTDNEIKYQVGGKIRFFTKRSLNERMGRARRRVTPH